MTNLTQSGDDEADAKAPVGTTGDPAAPAQAGAGDGAAAPDVEPAVDLADAVDPVDPVDPVHPVGQPDLAVTDDPEDLPAVVDPYVNPEFFTPKELSGMIAGFGVQLYVAMKARNSDYSHRDAIAEAASIASLAIEDRAIGNIFSAVTERNGLARDVMQDSRRRLAEMLEEQAAADAAAALAQG